MAKSTNPPMSTDAITPFQLAQLAIALTRKGSAPQVKFYLAKQLLEDAQRYLAGDKSTVIEYAKTSEELAESLSKPLGWSALISLLNGSVRKRAGRKHRVLTSTDVTEFLKKCFGTPKADKADKADILVRLLDARELAPSDARIIVEKWLNYRRAWAKKGTDGRKKEAAKRQATQEKLENRKQIVRSRKRQ